MFPQSKISIFAVVKGYHAYKVKPDVGEILECEMEPGNPHDRIEHGAVLASVAHDIASLRKYVEADF